MTKLSTSDSSSSSKKKARVRDASSTSNGSPSKSEKTSSSSSKPTLKRQATPFATSKAAKSGTTASNKPTLAKLEEDAESDADEDGDGDANMDASENEDDTAMDTTRQSLAAKFEAASHDEESAEEDESEDEEAEESGPDSDDEQDQPAKKKRKTGIDSAVTANAALSSSTTKDDADKPAKSIQIIPANDKELTFHLKQLHRLMKKLRAFQIKKVVRKLKETKVLAPPPAVIQALESDLELTKHFSLDHMSVYAWRWHNLGLTGKKAIWSEPEKEVTLENIIHQTESQPKPRLKELLSQVLTSPAAIKAIHAYMLGHQKKLRKDKGRSKKLDEIAEAATKRKEKEKKQKDAQEQRERKQKEEKLAAATAIGEDKSNSSAQVSEPDSHDDESDSEKKTSEREKKRLEKLAKRDAEKKTKQAAHEAKKQEIANATAAKVKHEDVVMKDASGSESDSGNESGSDSGAESDSSSDSIGAAKKPSKASKPSRFFSGLATGTIITGLVSGVESFGLFIEFVWKKKERKGLVHISMVSDSYIKNLGEEYKKGDLVECIVTKLDEKTGKISLGIKNSLFPPGHVKKSVVHTSSTFDSKLLEDSHKKSKKKLSDIDQAKVKLESVFVDSLGSKDPATTEEQERLKTIKRFMLEVSGTGKQKSEKKNRLGQRERRKLIGAVLGTEAIKPVLEEKPRAGHNGASWKKKDQEKNEPTSAAPPSSSSTVPSTSASVDSLAYLGLNRRERRLKQHQEAAARGEAKPEFLEALAAGKFERLTQKPKRPNKAEGETSNTSEPTTTSSSKPHTTLPKPTYSKPSASTKPSAAAPSTVAPPALDDSMHPSWLAKQAQAAKLAAAPKGKKITFD